MSLGPAPFPQADSAPLLAVKDLYFRYASVEVLFGIDIEVAPGEAVALLGTNGAGKSTLLRAISGLDLPSSGSVRFNGLDVTEIPAERRVRRGIAHVPGGRGVFPSLTVLENLRTGAYSLGRCRCPIEESIERVFSVFPELAERRSQAAGTLSGGQQQMLALGRAFLTEPKLVMIDELTLGLAPSVVQRLAEALRVFQQRGVALLLVEQSVNVALALCERAYFLERGQVTFSGRTRELLERPDIVRSVFLEGARSALAPAVEESGS